MKRLIVLLLVVMVACMGIAQAAEWREGLSPSKPYTNAKEIDLSETLGYWMLSPSADLQPEHSCQRLFIYLPREDVKAGDGTFYLCSQKGGKLWSTPMNDTSAVTQREITEAELVSLIWGGGTCFEIQLPETLTLGETYFINMEQNCIIAETGVSNQEIGGTEMWRFTVGGDFGVSAMQYLRDGEKVTTPEAGDTIRFDLVLGGEAAMAVVYGYNDTVDFSVTTFTESCEVTGEVVADGAIWGVMFLDEQGQPILNGRQEPIRVEFW